MGNLVVKKVPVIDGDIDTSRLRRRTRGEEENREDEEKPVAPQTSATSEETHGGTEITESIEDSQNMSGGSQGEARDQDEQCNYRSGSGTDSREGSMNTEDTSQQNLSQEDMDTGTEEIEDIDSNRDRGDQDTGTLNEEDTGEESSSGGEASETQNNESTGEDVGDTEDEVKEDRYTDISEEGSRDTMDTEDNERDSSESMGIRGEEQVSPQNSEDDSVEGDVDDEYSGDQDDSGGEDWDNDNEYDEEYKYKDSDDWSKDEDVQEQSPSYQWNTVQVVDVVGEEKTTNITNIRYLQTLFYMFLEKFSEDKLKIRSYDDFDEWDIRRLILRPYERKPLTAYRCTRIKDRVVLVLDNSGSMLWWTWNLRILAHLAFIRDDVEIYIAPNGYFSKKLTRKGLVQVDHEKVMKELQGRRIIYVGDFDGADTAVELSWRNDVVWVCPETRYKYFMSHDWVHYDESAFKGVFIRAWSLEEMFKGFKSVTRFYRQWIDFHENHAYQDTY